MRRIPAAMQRLLDAGGPFIGDNKPSSRVTVDVGWYLSATSGRVGSQPANKLPVRWFQRADNSQVETEVPNVKSVTIDRTIDQDAGTLTLEIYNQRMDADAVPSTLLTQLGEPGYYSWSRGQSREAQSRWNQYPNTWANVLNPNCLLRVYQGYGGANLSIPAAIAAGNIMLTGVFLVDTVTLGTGGLVQIAGRDMAKLLIDQQTYPPLVPSSFYPLHYERWHTVIVSPTTSAAGAFALKRCVYIRSTSELWYGGSGSIYGHTPRQAHDGNNGSYWLSVGNWSPSAPYAVEYIEYGCDERMNAVYVLPYMGNYQCFISIMENGTWQGPLHIAYNPAGIGRYNGVNAAAIPAVIQFGLPWETAGWYQLPRHYQAQRVRWTLTNLQNSGLGSYPYRGGIRELAIGDDGGGVTDVGSTTTTEGTYKDYTDIVRDLLLWSGWWLYDASQIASNNLPQVFGNLETTGAYNMDGGEGILDASLFDKKPVIDGIKAIRDIVGYLFRVDETGAARFEAPNWWSAGNFFDDGTKTMSFPVLDERLNVSDYSMAASDAPLRSEIIVAEQDPAEFPTSGWPTTIRMVPPDISPLRGMVKPLMMGVPYSGGALASTVSMHDKQVFAELIALQIWYARRQGQVTAVYNPAVSIDTQVRVYERITGDTFLHYVRGMKTEHDLDSGKMTMTLTTHWLGDRDNFVITDNANSFPGAFQVSQPLRAWLAALRTPKTSVFRSPPSAPTVVTPVPPPILSPPPGFTP